MVEDVVMIEDEKAPCVQWGTSKAESEDNGRFRPVLVAYKNFSANEAVIGYKGTQVTTIERPINRIIALVTNPKCYSKPAQIVALGFGDLVQIRYVNVSDYLYKL